MDSEGEFPEIARAALPLATLGMLSNGTMHGYALVERLRLLGFSRIQGGTLYPLLKRFQDRGWASFEWVHDDSGPGRKVFSLTAEGERERQRMNRAWSGMTRTLRLIERGLDESEDSSDDRTANRREVMT